MAVSYMTQCIKYWTKRLQMPTNRYAHQGYKMPRSLDEAGRITWASHIHTLLFEHGFGYLFVSYLFVNLCHVFSSSWCQGLAVTSACGSSWTFLFTCFYIWIANTVGDANRFINIFTQRIKGISIQNWRSRLNELLKAEHYKYFKSLLNVERYFFYRFKLSR